jgi:signal transduction histidine kinase
MQPFILLVDDNPKNLQILNNFLRDSNYRTAIAKSGEAALESISMERPDLILLDIMMPVMDGFEVCHRLKDNPYTRDIPVIFVTALTETNNKLRGFHAGGIDYITKPFHKEEVLARIENHLTIRRQAWQLYELNSQLSESNEKLRSAINSKDKLFSVIGHDMRGPIGNLQRLLQLLLEDALEPEERDEMIRESLKSLRYTHDLLENLLFWARSQKSELSNQPEVFRLDDAVIENVLMLDAVAKDKGQILRHDVPANILVYADRNMVNLIIRNLLTNAIKFTHDGGIIEVKGEIQQSKALVMVKDTGVGFSRDNQKIIFQDKKTCFTHGTRGEKGTGLGLALCIDFIGKIGGTYFVESKENHGTVFSFTLPLAP